MVQIRDEGLSLWWLLPAGIILIAGVAVSALMIMNLVTGMEDMMTPIVMPGEHIILCEDPGTYTIYHEHQTVIDGRVYSSPSGVRGLQVDVEKASTGEAIGVRSPAMRETYSMGSRQGYAILQFRVNDPGEYRIVGSFPEGGAQKTMLTVSSGMLKKMFTAIIGALTVFFISGAIALAILIWVLVSRSKTQQRA